MIYLNRSYPEIYSNNEQSNSTLFLFTLLNLSLTTAWKAGVIIFPFTEKKILEEILNSTQLKEFEPGLELLLFVIPNILLLAIIIMCLSTHTHTHVHVLKNNINGTTLKWSQNFHAIEMALHALFFKYSEY